MKGFTQGGQTMTFVAPYDVLSGAGFLVGVIFAVALFSALSGAQVEGKREGVFTLAKATGQTWTAYTTKLYWDNTAKNVTSTAGGNTFIGVATAAAATGDTVGSVLVTGQVS